MSAIKTLSTLLHIGTRHVADGHEKLLICKVNGIACSLILLSLGFGLLFYFISGHLIVLIATSIESALFVAVIALNHFGRHQLATTGLLVVLHAAILYFGLLLGKAIDGLWLALFLIVTSLLFLQNRTAVRVSLAGSGILLGVIEANKFHAFVAPFPFTPVVQLVVHYSAIGVILFLTVLTLLHYMQHNTSLVNKVKAHTQELEKANRSLKVFLRELTHEIRTPLNAIYSISQLKLIEAKTDTERITDQHLHFACHHVLSIINNVQDKSKIEAGHPDDIKRESIDPREWIQEIAHIYRYFADTREVRIRVETAENLPAVIWEDKTILTKITSNIIGNAIKFTKKNTTVTVRVQQQDTLWHISVKDQGAGISQDRMPALFDEFTRERINFAEGTGLGLHIARKLANLLQGDIQVSSLPGQGATFTISLPLHTPEGDALTATGQDTADHVSFRDKKVLLVEDDPMSRQYLHRYLAGIGFTVALAESGQEGLYRAGCVPYDVIISDIGLPGMDGKALLTQLKSSPFLRHIPVIITSADTAVREDVLQAGASGCLIKPVDFKLLCGLLKRLLPDAASADYL
ncbi:ATP-binding response regulator [Chitinophaga japonensis]|uniref:histidine kinase n=1 Tax=Chitinophaga japonensis TaxID=104662 RepID=A0A562T0J8_CHIJA|nr:ATP-binding protein [Chitinophaga japonensis]TWI86606.1 response regulator receiver domain-containing protein [Chitinophaga japonensis]